MHKGSKTMSIQENKKRIIELLNSENIVYSKDLEKELHVSEATVRRYLSELEQEKKIKRIHGGAIPLSFGSVMTPNKEIFMRERIHIQEEEKKQLCKKAASMIQDGDCVFVDGGTTLLPIIDLIKDKHIEIITHNVLIVSSIGKEINAHIFLVGGSFNEKYAMSTGPETIKLIDNFDYDIALIGCSGIDLHTEMAYTTEVDTREIKNIAIKNAHKKILLVDHSKIGVRGSCKFQPFTTFDTIICDYPNSIEDIPENFIRP